MEERSADGSLLGAWRQPKKLVQILYVLPGFGAHPIRVQGRGHGASGLSTSSHQYAIHPNDGIWSWLASWSQSWPMMNV